MDTILPLHSKSTSKTGPPSKTCVLSSVSCTKIAHLPERGHAAGLVLENPPVGIHAKDQKLKENENHAQQDIPKPDNSQPIEPPTWIRQCYITEPPQEFDEPGQELARDAQVWKTYVKEADAVDAERVDGWKQTSDVILIFAALFSAVSTAFVIESYKSLKPDPAEASVEILRAMSRTLLIVANQTQPTGSQIPEPENESDFSPSWSAICVNLLWFLSLSISILVSLIAMLSKEWCSQFMSGRTGSPVAQARRRQQRWDGIVEWRMEGVLTFLPSLIHLALLLFAVGLSIFLCEIHLAIGLPVSVVTLAGAIIYILCTLVPFYDTYCPYGTTLSRIYQQLFDIKLQVNQDDLRQDNVTSQAIAWMLTNCETPRSVEIALQSIGAATPNLDLWRINNCLKAWSKMGEQFLDSQLSNAQPNQAVSLWASSLLRWGHFRHLGIIERYEHPTSRNTMLEAMIWAMQIQIDQLCAVSSDLPTKSDEVVEIRRLVSNTAHHCIKELYRTHEDSSSGTTPWYSWQCNTQPIEMVVDFLEQHLSSPDANVLEPMTYQALCISFTLLLCCFLAHCSPPIAVRYLLRLLRTPHGSYSSEIQLAMMAFVFSRHDLPGWSQSTQGHVDLRVQRALEVYHYYQKAKFKETSIHECEETGYLFLLASPQLHGLDDADLKLIAQEWHFFFRSNGTNVPYRVTFNFRTSKSSSVYTVPSYTELIENALRYLTQDVARDLHAALNNPHLAEAYSLVLRSSLDGLNRERFEWVTVELYGFVLEDIKSHPFESLAILSRIPLPQLSPLLDEYLDSRNIVSQLVRLLDDEKPDVQLFATSQIWHLIRVSSPTSDEHSKTRVALEQQLLKPDSAWGSADGLKGVSGLMKTRLYQLLEQQDGLDYWALKYGYRVMECMLEEDECSLSDPRMKKVQEWLDEDEITKSIRGLSSFITFPPTQTQAHVV